MNQRRREGVWLCYCVTRVTGYGHGGTEAGTAPPGHSGHRTTAHLTKHYYRYTFLHGYNIQNVLFYLPFVKSTE